MRIDLDKQEAKIVVNAIRGYLGQLREANAELIEHENHRRLKAGKPQGFCCLFEDDQEVINKLKQNCAAEERFCEELRDKFKKFQMEFPCEEHKHNKYDYGKVFGYEKANWSSE